MMYPSEPPRNRVLDCFSIILAIIDLIVLAIPVAILLIIKEELTTELIIFFVIVAIKAIIAIEVLVIQIQSDRVKENLIFHYVINIIGCVVNAILIVALVIALFLDPTSKDALMANKLKETPDHVLTAYLLESLLSAALAGFSIFKITEIKNEDTYEPIPQMMYPIQRFPSFEMQPPKQSKNSEYFIPYMIPKSG